VSLYSQSLGVAIAQSTDAIDASGEIQALRRLLEAMELEGVLVQADAQHANRHYSTTLPRAAPTSCSPSNTAAARGLRMITDRLTYNRQTP